MHRTFTVPELARHLGVRIGELRQWIVEGVVPQPEWVNGGHAFGYYREQVAEIEQWYMQRLQDKLNEK